MKRFLEEVVDNLYTQHGKAISNVLFVLPNRRAGLFLKQYLLQAAGPNIFAPRILSISEFIEELCPYDIADQITQLFELYQTSTEIEGTDAEPFEQFSKWGRIMLNDFNDIHSYLLPAQSIYTNLRDLKQIENWSLGEDHLTAGQNEYVEFWDKLSTYHEKFTQRLLQKNKCYQGYAYRWVAENLEAVKAETGKNPIVFAGLNALSTAEQRIIEGLATAGHAEVFWDTDTYYLNNPNHEAGHFLRSYRKTWDLPFQWEHSNLRTSAKNITLIGVPGFIGQAKVAGDLLSQSGNTNDILNTALVLADEGLLLPVLNTLPTSVEKVNVTMGYPLQNTPMQSLFDAVFTLHENVGRLGREQHPNSFYHDDILKLLHHPYIKQLLRTEETRNVADSIAFYIRESNKIFLDKQVLFGLIEDAVQLEKLTEIGFLFEPVNRIPEDLNTLLDNLIHTLLQHLATGETQQLELEYLYNYAKILKRLDAMLERYPFLKSIKAYRQLFHQIASNTSIDFYGEPLQGLQIMGMLETRALDFERVIMLSVNENTIPQSRTDNSFIPFDLRKHFGLPTYAEKDAIYAYHFYRILQRAGDITLVYNTQTDDFGAGERSRFIAQILHELPLANPNIEIREMVLSTPLRQHPLTELIVRKDDLIYSKLEALFESGLSPTALTTFINCPLDFYHRYILGFRETSEVEVTVEASSFGTFIHNAMEALYTPHIGSTLLPEHVEEMQTKVAALLEAEFVRLYDGQDMQFGKNLLIFKVANQFIQRYLEAELETLQQLNEEGKQLQIVSLEEELKVPVQVMLADGTPTAINITGKVDRIDKIGDQLRIIDYKTGMVKPNNLKVANMQAISQDIAFEKAFQVLTYALMYQKAHPEQEAELQSGIIAFRNINSGVMTVEIDKSSLLTPQLLNDFEHELTSLIRRILDHSTPLRHHADSTRCLFCERE